MATEKQAVKHNCDLCGQDDPKYLEMVPGAAVCGNCGFVYVVYRRGSAEIAKAWDDVWGDGYTSAWPMVKARLTYVAEWIDQNIGLEGKTVLDIGAGEGTFLGMLSDYGIYSYMGIEPSAENCQKMEKVHLPYWQGTLEDAEGAEEKFDIVTVLWTLENCGDCIDFLKRAKSFLKPDGHLVVATGSRILVPFKKPLSAYVGSNPPDLHCFRFSQNSLARAMSLAEIRPGYFNRAEDSDWMIVGGYPDVGEVDSKDLYDNPAEVLQFFNDWQRMFP